MSSHHPCITLTIGSSAHYSLRERLEPVIELNVVFETNFDVKEGSEFSSRALFKDCGGGIIQINDAVSDDPDVCESTPQESTWVFCENAEKPSSEGSGKLAPLNQFSEERTCHSRMKSSSFSEHSFLVNKRAEFQKKPIVLNPDLTGGVLFAGPQVTDTSLTSPSMPLTFFMSPATDALTTKPEGNALVSLRQTGVPDISRAPEIQSNNVTLDDIGRLQKTREDLLQTSWYHEGLSWNDSFKLLRSSAPGTFLIRDSTNPEFLYSLSVQTERGPTSVRIHYSNGQFRLDAESTLAPHMPCFNGVVPLIEHYVEQSKRKSAKKRVLCDSCKKVCAGMTRSEVWLDDVGQVHSDIVLLKPRLSAVPSLKQMCRVQINRNGIKSTGSSDGEPLLPVLLQHYVTEYQWNI